MLSPLPGREYEDLVMRLIGGLTIEEKAAVRNFIKLGVEHNDPQAIEAWEWYWNDA